MVDFILACLPVVSWPAAFASVGIATLRLAAKFLEQSRQAPSPDQEETAKQLGELNDRVNAISLEIGFGSERRK